MSPVQGDLEPLVIISLLWGFRRWIWGPLAGGESWKWPSLPPPKEGGWLEGWLLATLIWPWDGNLSS